MQSEGKSYTQSTAKANVLNKQFASVYTKENRSSVPSLHGESFPDIGTFHIESNGIEKLVSLILILKKPQNLITSHPDF